MDNNIQPAQPVQQQMPEKKKSGKILPAIFAFFVLILVALGGFVLGANQSKVNTKPQSEQSMTEATRTPNPTSVEVTTMPSSQPQKIMESTLQNYTDSDIPFTLSYPKTWTLKKTYGKEISKAAPTNVLSGIEIKDPINTAIFVINVIDAKNATSIANWWQTGSHTTFNATQANFSFKGMDAIKVSSTPGGNPVARVQDETYFLWKGNVYFLSMQYTPYNFNPDLVNIYNSFNRPQ